MLAAGTIFAGYVIERQLGRGGMGSVYLAQDSRSARRAALKLLNQELFSDHRIRARFEREADLVMRLVHPNIVAAYDSGLEDEQLWIAMQYIDGADAGTLDPQTLPPQKALWIECETATALDFAHEKGVLHRDVKPANILLTRASAGPEQVFLTDFGIAKLRDDAGHLTQTGAFNATLAFASPEQLMGAPLDPTSDQYSLACTLFWLLTGAAPFESKHAPVVVQGHLQKPPPAISEVRWGLPVQLDAVLQRALSKRPNERFRSCAEFAEAARLAISGGSSADTGAAGTGPQSAYQMPSAAAQSMPRQPVAGDPRSANTQSVPRQPTAQMSAQPTHQMHPAAGHSMPQQPVAGVPVYGQHVPAQSVPRQPTAGDPVYGQYGPAQPVPRQPTAQMGAQPSYQMHPAAGHSMPQQPVAGDPVYGQPMSTQSVPQQPVAAQHGYGQQMPLHQRTMESHEAGMHALMSARQASPSRSKTGLIIGLCAGLLVLIVIAVVLIAL
ncbi:serine/threonine-protein kinase [Nocardia sp. XZ_19_385]|uniref:serine/threonine protein kinase n=1 Tax=Nocardia sp. XZ_19_385 TaxID=2769488 RepID=UPI00188F1988|nr:serine/threonine-protein kinase [Nocardia sp. XZ_19_385]